MRDYQAFRSNPAIDSLSGKRIWTVSHSQTKCPIDIFEYTAFHRVAGAKVRNELSLTTLDHVNELFPTAPNRACYLNSAVEGLMVLDIEKTCPPAVRDRLLRFPCLYAERSMSGKGYHMLMRVPEKILRAYPAARTKDKMKHELGWYEFLLDHYVTFTGDVIDAGGQDVQEFLAVFMCLAKKQEEVHAGLDAACPSLRDADRYENDQLVQRAIEILTNGRNPFGRTVADYNGDQSLYEYCLISNRYVWLQRIMLDPAIMDGRAFTDEEIVWILYRAAQLLVDHRPKHDTLRNGMPFLMYQAHHLYSSKKPMPPPDDPDACPDGDEGGREA